MSLGRYIWPHRKSAAAVCLALANLIGSGFLHQGPLWAQIPDAPPSETVTYSLNLDEALTLARRALDLGNPALAARIATQILSQRSEDPRASLLLTAAYSRLGQHANSAREGRRAYGLATNAEMKFQAAFLIAGSLSHLDRPAASKRWLRRADMAKPNGDEAKHLRRAFALLEQRTPLKLGFQFNMRPTNNVNGGSLHDSFEVWGLKIPISQALPGVAVDGTVRLSYRLKQTTTTEWSSFAQLSRHEVFLSARAQSLQPDLAAWQLASTGLDLGIAGIMQTSAQSSLRLSGQIGRRWAASGTQRELQRLDFGLRRGLSDDRLLEGNVSLQALQYPEQANSNSVQLATDIGLNMPIGKGRIGFSLGAMTNASNAAGVAYNAASFSVNWQNQQFEDRVAFTVFGNLEGRDYWRTSFAPDLLITAGISAEFSKVSLMGFSPVATLSANRTISEVVVRDTFDLGVSIGLTSRF